MKVGIVLSFLFWSLGAFANTEGYANTGGGNLPDTELSYEEMLERINALQNKLTHELLCIEGVRKLENGDWEIVYPTNAEGRARHAKFMELIEAKRQLISDQIVIHSHMLRMMSATVEELNADLAEMLTKIEGHNGGLMAMLKKANAMSKRVDEMTDETRDLYRKLLLALAKAFKDFARETQEDTCHSPDCA